MSDEIGRRLEELLHQIEAQITIAQRALDEGARSSGKHDAAIAVIESTLNEQGPRIAELMARMAAIERLAGIRLGHMGARPTDSDPAVITDHAPNTPR